MEQNTPTPHNAALPGDFAKTVLMPGDPLRSKFIAETFLTAPKAVNNVRGVQGYTGTYRGTSVSVMASGMGMPSIGIYSYELFHYYGVDSIIRVGSCGAIAKDLKLRDLVFGMGACTDSNYGAQFKLPGVFAPVADFGLLTDAVKIAKDKNLPYRVGNLLSSDLFYGDDPQGGPMLWEKMGVLAVEMESAALYMNAARAGKRALAICTVSDSIPNGEALSSTERQLSFCDMVEVALEVAKANEDK